MALRPSRLLLLRRFRPEVVRRFSDGEVEESEGKICRKGLIVGVYYNPETKEHKFTPAGQTINNRTGGKLDELLKGGKPLSQGRSSVFQYLDENFHHVVVVGLGREDACYNQVENLDEFRENIRVAAANGITRLQSKGVTEAFVESLGNAEAAAEGSVLTVYEYQELKSKETRRNIPRVHLYQNDDIAGWKRGVIKAEAQNLARRLCETPANLMTPAIFAQNAVEALCPCGVSVEVRDRDWAESKRMTAFMAVAKGSCEPPVILELGYCGGNQEQKPITFVGKGSTFDAGGLCLRRFLGMEEFRADMAGAAVVVSVMRAAASLSLPLNLQAVIPLCENMPSGMALKPGDVVQGMNGKSIRIDATDNEGRLMLADALNYAYHTFKPYILMDIGTLTEGTLHALADAATAVYTNSEEIWRGMSKAGAITGDRVWRMPLWKHFTGKIANIGSADMTNKGNGPGGGACRAAAFMKEMVPCGHWMHLDISNTGMKAHNADFPYLRVGRMTGRPTRTLIQFLYQLSCADFKDKPPVK